MRWDHWVTDIKGAGYVGVKSQWSSSSCSEWKHGCGGGAGMEEGKGSLPLSPGGVEHGLEQASSKAGAQQNALFGMMPFALRECT